MDRKRLAGTFRLHMCATAGSTAVRTLAVVQVQSDAVITLTAIICGVIVATTGDLIGERIDLRMDQKKTRLDSNIQKFILLYHHHLRLFSSSQITPSSPRMPNHPPLQRLTVIRQCQPDS
jgi:hypothetical protein